MDAKQANEKPACPMCKSPDCVIPIIYGKPTKELLDQWSKGEIELGGCLSLDGRQPPWTCIACAILID
ncbi:MAG: hypothetical protein Q8R30_05970 [bacterium]|nr:hypothetical protein [bacterium]MDZ4285990.1 hypothetical protein [Candidatus Sungbacteria bacterium]